MPFDFDAGNIVKATSSENVGEIYILSTHAGSTTGSDIAGLSAGLSDEGAATLTDSREDRWRLIFQTILEGIREVSHDASIPLGILEAKLRLDDRSARELGLPTSFTSDPSVSLRLSHVVILPH